MPFIYIISGIILVFLFLLGKTEGKKEAARKIKIAEEQKRAEIARRNLLLKRIEDKKLILEHYQSIRELHSTFSLILQDKNGYFNNYKLEEWQSRALLSYNTILHVNLGDLDLDNNIRTVIGEFRQYLTNGDMIRQNFNKSYIKNELQKCSSFFDNIEGSSLDQQQREAVVKDEDNNLVIAGAGSGKTTTVAGKVAYLLQYQNIKPEDILLITFTKKASDDMKQRIRTEMGIDIDVNTFHSFGRKVIGAVTKKMPSVVESKEFNTEMKSIFATLMKNPTYASSVIKFLTEYKNNLRGAEEFNNHGEYINYIKDNNIKSYKTIERVINGRITILREACKSIEEVQIANYLFLNGINYQYEAKYCFPTANNIYAQYKPDFYLLDSNIYLEHFALIDRSNNVPKWFSDSNGMSAKKKYNDDIAWKRATHKEHKTILLETYSYENREGTLLNKLKGKLEKAGVTVHPRSDDEIWAILNDVAKDDVTALDTLINTFLSLFKSNNFTIKAIEKQIVELSDDSSKARELLFLSIFTPILEKYNSYLKKNNLIDFSDMINEASKYITTNKFTSHFKYIIIDEFQDTSVGRFKLIKALLDNVPNSKLFAVGDDWQSIYRFAGSDIALFTQFEKYFGVTEFSKIETTYRFNRNMVDLSSKFILANPNQTSKNLIPHSKNESASVEILYSDSFRNDDPQPLIDALTKIDAETVSRKSNIKIFALSRYNHFINLYKDLPHLFSVKYNTTENTDTIVYLKLPHLSVDFLSVHRSKGLQADYTIILNCVSGQYGFPSEQADDPILSLLLSKSDQFENGEERRLFYVALTRAKVRTFITTNKFYESKFISEIDSTTSLHNNNYCPICILGTKIKNEGINKHGDPYIRYTCSNWNYGCAYLEWV